MLQKTSRKLVKNVLNFTKVKLLYTRITLTRYTAVFFWAALINCIVGAVFQGISLNDHIEADTIVSEIFSSANLNDTNMGLPLLQGNQILVCDGIPGVNGVTCNTMGGDRTMPAQTKPKTSRDLPLSDCSILTKRADGPAKPVTLGGELIGVSFDDDVLLDMPCVASFVWLAEMLRDAKREDIATMAFQIWLLTLAVVTILNESLPHLGTVLIGHVMLTGWAGFRIHESFNLRSIYENGIVGGPCQEYDPLGDWWDRRMAHAIPMVAMNGVALVIMGGLSIKLFSVYAKQTFCRVGAAPQVHHLYKLVLFLSVTLQLTGFFSMASLAIWIDKIAYGPVRQFVEHFPLYLGLVCVMAVFTVPWLILGWISVRREQRRWILVFFGVSGVIVAISTLMFVSPVYRFVFDRWPFFATLTVTSYVLMLATVIIGFVCRTNFGQGLAQYLNVTDALEGADFTPVMFSTGSADEKGSEKSSVDEEKGLYSDRATRRPSTTRKSSLFAPRPVLTLQTETKRSSFFSPGNTKIMSPTPAFLRGDESKPLSPSPTAHRGRAPSFPRTHTLNTSDSSEVLPTLSYHSNQPDGRNVGVQRKSSTKSSISSISPPVLPPLAAMPALPRLRETPGKVGLPSQPRARTPSPPARSADKPGFF